MASSSEGSLSSLKVQLGSIFSHSFIVAEELECLVFSSQECSNHIDDIGALVAHAIVTCYGRFISVLDKYLLQI